MLTTNQKTPIFRIEKSRFLSKKRNLSLSNQQNLSTSSSPNRKMKQSDIFFIEGNTLAESNNIIQENKNINQPIFKKGKWSEEEDILLKKYIKKYGEGKWSKIEKIFIGRTRKQIRQRYISNIKIKKLPEEKNEKISNDLYSSSEEEDNNENYKIEKEIIFKWDNNLDKILLKEYFLSKKSWVKISKKIPGSTENSVKNRFYSLLRQKVNKLKKEYKYKHNTNTISKNKENNNYLMSQIKKEIYGYKKNNNIEDAKETLINNIFFDSEYFNNKSKKRNYSVEFLLEFLPELLEEKGIDICEILDELKERKNKATNQLFTVIEKHIDCLKNSDNNDCNSISTDIEFDNLKNLQSEKLGMIIKNMKLKIMYKYFHKFRYNTLGM